jgi:hypothetical protein
MQRLAFSLSTGVVRQSVLRGAPLRPLLCHLTFSRATAAGPRMAMVGGRRRALATERTLVPGRPSDYPEFSGDVSAPAPENGAGPPTDADGMVLLKCMTLPELEDWVVNTLGHKRYRARQLWSWMYKEEQYASSFAEMTDLAKAFRAELEAVARIDCITIDKVHQSKDGTRKILFRLLAGGVVESVLIPAEGRSTLCFSSQRGCAFNCQVRASRVC